MTMNQPPPWRPGPPPPPMWQPRPPKPPVSGTATAALTIAALTIPASIFSLLWIPVAGVAGGPLLIFGMIAAFVLLPVILGFRALREIRDGRAHPISRQRAVLAMGISGVWGLLALGVLIQWATGG